MNTKLKKLQKETGIKMGKYDNKKNECYHKSKAILGMIKLFVKEIEENELYNEQFYLDFEDEINELSIKDHNKPISE